MKSVSEISREYGIPVSTINSAGEAGLLDAIEQESGPRRIDETSEQFQSWLAARMQQSRVKGELGTIKELAQYASAHHLRIPSRHVPSDYAIVEPLTMLFHILESSTDDLDFAQAASTGEIERVTRCGMDVAQEYVSIFYQQIGGNRAERSAIMRLLSRQRQIRSAYKVWYRAGNDQ